MKRLAIHLERSIDHGTQWAVFEPNGARLSFGEFPNFLFRQGAFQELTPDGVDDRQGCFVNCNRETTTQSDINHGILNIVVGFTPPKPAEFVIIRIQQKDGQVRD